MAPLAAIKVIVQSMLGLLEHYPLLGMNDGSAMLFSAAIQHQVYGLVINTIPETVTAAIA